jgi:hypothetical protein
MLSDSSETRFDVPLTQQRRESISGEDRGLVGANVYPS